MKKIKRTLKVLLALAVFITLSYPAAAIIAASWIFIYVPCFVVMYINSGNFEESQYKAGCILEDCLCNTVMGPFSWIEEFLKED